MKHFVNSPQIHPTHIAQTFACSESAIEAIEKNVKYVQS